MLETDFQNEYHIFMLHRLLIWIREHKLATLVIVVLTFFVFKDRLPTPIMFDRLSTLNSGYSVGTEATLQAPYDAKMYPETGSFEAPMPLPPTGSGDMDYTVTARMVSKEAYLSMVVKDVQEASNAMVRLAEQAGGYMVTSNLNNPDGNGSANLTVRVLSSKLRDTLDEYRKIGIKVVSENITGADITDAYQDIAEELRVLSDTKAKFEAMLKTSTDVQDSLSVLREVQQLQRQIDGLRGQEKYLEASAKYSIITVSISKDEYELPYAPEESWSAANVFKNAVRELIRTLRTVAEKVIWVAVYAIIWAPVALIAFLVYKRFLRKMM